MNYTHSCPLTQSLQMNVSSELYCCKHILISCICSYFLCSPPPRLLLLQQEQLEVFTDEHLLFTTPSSDCTCVITIANHTGTRLSEKLMFNISCQSVRRLGLFVKVYHCEIEHNHVTQASKNINECKKKKKRQDYIRSSRHSQRALLKSLSTPVSYRAGVSTAPRYDEVIKRQTRCGNIRTLSDDMLSTLWYGLFRLHSPFCIRTIT